jgi:hypothetical protein
MDSSYSGVDSIELFEKIICAKCGPMRINPNKRIGDCSQLTCDSCQRVLVSCCGNDESALEINSQLHKFVSLPALTQFFHLNEDILYRDLNFNNKSFYENKSLLLVGCGNIEGTSVLRNLKKMDLKLKVNLVRAKCWTEEFFDDSIIAEHENIDEKEATLNAVRAYMLDNNVNFDAILTFNDESCVLMVSYLADELGCLGIPFRVAQTIRNKYEFRNYCSRLGIPTPKYTLVHSDDR